VFIVLPGEVVPADFVASGVEVGVNNHLPMKLPKSFVFVSEDETRGVQQLCSLLLVLM